MRAIAKLGEISLSPLFVVGVCCQLIPVPGIERGINLLEWMDGWMDVAAPSHLFFFSFFYSTAFFFGFRGDPVES